MTSSIHKDAARMCVCVDKGALCHPLYDSSLGHPPLLTKKIRATCVRWLECEMVKPISIKQDRGDSLGSRRGRGGVMERGRGDEESEV